MGDEEGADPVNSLIGVPSMPLSFPNSQGLETAGTGRGADLTQGLCRVNE